VDDFELDFNAGSDMWVQHVANQENLKSFTEKTEVHLMNPPRPGKPLLVLDLDHTLLCFSSRQLQQGGQTQGEQIVASMKRPFMNDFLTKCYRHFDMVVWSQTSWRWLETKLIEVRLKRLNTAIQGCLPSSVLFPYSLMLFSKLRLLSKLGMVTHPGYKFSFVLDKTSMFTVVSTKRDGTSVKHHVKPLQIVWSKFPQWGSHNTVHIDDLSRNFALNISSGLQIKAYYRKKSSARNDVELLGLARYLEQLAHSKVNFDQVDFNRWTDVVAGTRPLYDKDVDNDEDEKDKS